MTHSGPWMPSDAAETSDVVGEARVSLVVLGGAGASTRWAERVGAELDAQLTAEDAAGRTPVVLWLGGTSLPRYPNRRHPECPVPDTAAERAGVADIEAAVRRHVARGHASYAVPGVAEWACGTAESMVQARADAGGNPWQMPEHHFIVRVGTDGSTTVVSRCSGEPVQCHIDTAPAHESLVDLVIVDLAPWVAPPVSAADRAAKDRQVARLDALLAALRTTEDAAAVPRILVSSVPVEAAGYTGMGGGGASAAYHYLPPSLQSAVGDGLFAGSIGAHDRAVYATPDITSGVRRSSRAWLSSPVFQIVSGSASLPDARPGAGARRIRYFRSDSYVAEAYSDRAGFAVV
ncbi:MAG: hypothetical protein AAF721_42065, partial [Myxococcota bacterium]